DEDEKVYLNLNLAECADAILECAPDELQFFDDCGCGCQYVGAPSVATCGNGSIEPGEDWPIPSRPKAVLPRFHRPPGRCPRRSAMAAPDRFPLPPAGRPCRASPGYRRVRTGARCSPDMPRHAGPRRETGGVASSSG